MDKSVNELRELIAENDGIAFGQLRDLTRINDSRVAALLKYLTLEGIIFRSGSIGDYHYHATREQALAAQVKAKETYIGPKEKEDLVASYKRKSAVYRFDQLLRNAAERAE